MFRKLLSAFVMLLLVSILAAPAAAQPKNVIFCIGDGMGFNQVQAAAYFDGAPLSFEALPHQGSVTTYAADSSVTDSAASATAMATARKVNNGVISQAYPGDGSDLPTLLEYYKAQGASTGLVTTTYMTHATPAAFGAHEPSRGNKSQIATDYLTQSLPNVLFGGGANGMSVATAQSAGYTVVTDAASLAALDTNATTYASGQFGSSNLPYEHDGLGSLPGLSDMTGTALDILDNDPNGFFLMVESGRIDHSGHGNRLDRNVKETVEFSETVADILAWASGRTDTLIIVTADHETGGLTTPVDNGAGNLPTASWTTGNHTGVDVPVYAWGANAHLINGLMDNTGFWNVVTALVPGDLDGDGDADADDVDLIVANIGGDPGTYDMDGDVDVDGDDMIYFVEIYLAYDSDGDGDPDGAGTFLGDFNADGVVDGTDLSIVNINFGSAVGFAGGNGNTDMIVNGTELSILAGTFGSVATAPVPEPMTLGLLAVGGLAILRRRR